MTRLHVIKQDEDQMRCSLFLSSNQRPNAYIPIIFHCGGLEVCKIKFNSCSINHGTPDYYFTNYKCKLTSFKSNNHKL